MAYTNGVAYGFQYVDVKQVIYEALMAELSSSDMEIVRVFKSDPIEQAQIPGIGINKIALNEEAATAGLGLVSQAPTYKIETHEYTTYSGVYMQEAVETRIFHQNPDERDKLAIMVLAVLFAVRGKLFEVGLQNITLSGGRDEQDNNLMSMPLFMHSITMHYINPLDVQVTTVVADVGSIDVTTDVY